MPKYALVVTSNSRLLPGVHAMLNAMKYYNAGHVEFHLVYWPCPEMDRFISDMQGSGEFPNFVPVNILPIKDAEGPEEQKFKPIYYLKFYRSLYAGRLRDYDAVGFMDADRAITGDISLYFELAEKSGQILMADHKFSKQRLDQGFYDRYPIQGTNGCPFDPSATFFDPNVWGDQFERVHRLGWEVVKNSEMPTVNYMLITEHLLEEIIRLPVMRWNVRKWGHFETSWDVDPNTGKRQLFIMGVERDQLIWHFRDVNQDNIPHGERNKYCVERFLNDHVDLMLAVHGRWWFRETLQRKPAKMDLVGNPRSRPGFLRQNRNMANIWEVFKFFNFCCYTRLEPWKPEWGTVTEYIEPETGLLWKQTGYVGGRKEGG